MKKHGIVAAYVNSQNQPTYQSTKGLAGYLKETG